MGPIISTEQLERVRSYLAVGGAEDAELVFGGGSGAQLFASGNELGGGYYVAPTLFRSEHNDLRICQEEIFGPVTIVIPFRDDDHALELANATRYGLAAGVFTQNISAAHMLARRLQAGQVQVNAYPLGGVDTPFGGYKQSGLGREKGVAALDYYTQLKTVILKN